MRICCHTDFLSPVRWVHTATASLSVFFCRSFQSRGLVAAQLQPCHRSTANFHQVGSFKSTVNLQGWITEVQVVAFSGVETTAAVAVVCF